MIYDYTEMSKNEIIIKIAENDVIHAFVDNNTDKVFVDREMKKPILCSCEGANFYSNGEEIYCSKCRKTYPVIYDYEDNQKAKKEMEEEYMEWCQEQIAKIEAK